jgi:hypothetical protein
VGYNRMCEFSGQVTGPYDRCQQSIRMTPAGCIGDVGRFASEEGFSGKFVDFVVLGGLVFALRNSKFEKFTEQKFVSCAWMVCP